METTKQLTKCEELLALVEGYQIPFLMEPVQEKAPKVHKLNQEQQKQVDLEVKAILEKGSISKVCHSKGEFLSSLFVYKKGDYMCKTDLKDAHFSVPLHKDL